MTARGMPQPIAYSVREAAVVLPLSTDTIYRLIRAGEIPARRVGGRWLIPTRGLERWIEDVGVAEAIEAAP
jgi:excisionase family DNA binding protein